MWDGVDAGRTRPCLVPEMMDVRGQCEAARAAEECPRWPVGIPDVKESDHRRAQHSDEYEGGLPS
jgi:hypothetical protein